MRSHPMLKQRSIPGLLTTLVALLVSASFVCVSRHVREHAIVLGGPLDDSGA